MTQQSIDEQIAVIKAATAKASVSKEAALEFLERAGIKSTPKKAIRAKTAETIEVQKEVSGHA